MSESSLDPEVFPRAPRPGAEALTEPLRSRWSPSLFDPTHEIADADVITLLRAAQWAPSWGNTQPWHWIVCRRGSGSFAHLEATLTRGNSRWVPRVSVVFVSVVQAEEVNGVEPSPYALYDTGQAAAHLTLQARAMGLQAHQFAGFGREDFAARMAIPGTHRVLSGVAVGDCLPVEQVTELEARDRERDLKPRTRRDLSEQAFEESWGTPWSGLVHMVGESPATDAGGTLGA